MSDTTDHNEKQNVAEHVDQTHNTTGIHVVRRVHADGLVDFIDAKAVGGDLDEIPKGYYTSMDFIFTFMAVCFASMCAYLGWVLPANTLLLINQDIGPSPNLNWVATAWTLGSGIGFLLVGRLSDIFGRKWMVLGCQVLGLVGCIVGATANAINTLIAANLCNGIAAAGQLSFGIVIGELVPNKQRGVAIAFVFLSSLPFAVFGPSIARAFFLHTSAQWRWSYYLGIIINALALIMYQFFYHPPTYDQLHVHGKSKWQQFKELDFGGLFLFLAGIVLFIIGLSWGGSTYPWASAPVICTIVIGLLTLVVFGLYEQYVFKGQALMPPRIFKNVGYVAIVIVATIGAAVYYAMTVLWPTILGLYTTDVAKIGMESSVVGGGILLGQMFGGFGLSYLPRVKWQAVLTSLLGATFIAALAAITSTSHAMTITFGVLGTFFIGWVDNITFPAVTLVWEAQDIGLATGVLGSIRAMGGAVAQAMYVSILTTKAAVYIPQYVTPAVVKAGLPESSLPALFAGLAGTGNLTSVPGATADILAIAGAETGRAYFSAIHVVFFATIPFGVLLVAAACFVPDMEQFLHNNVAKRLQTKNGGEAREGQDLSAFEKAEQTV